MAFAKKMLEERIISFDSFDVPAIFVGAREIAAALDQIQVVLPGLRPWSIMDQRRNDSG
jgi:hypothetical protein